MKFNNVFSSILAALLMAVCPLMNAVAEHITHARVDAHIEEFKIQRNFTYEKLTTLDVTLVTRRGVSSWSSVYESYYPEKESLELIEAWVDQPDGEHIVVPESSVFTRPSEASEDAPGFDSSMTTTVLFPQAHEGSRIHVKWKFIQKEPALLGFNFVTATCFNSDCPNHVITITTPKNMVLRWGTRGGIAVENHTENNLRQLVVRMPPSLSQESEPSMVSTEDFLPTFAITSLNSPEEMGAILYRASKGRADVTPEIVRLAAKIVGNKTGLEAARAIHSWVVANIRYVAVYLNPEDGYVPHSASHVLESGYGDCKDYTVIMQALLAARGIRSEATVIDWGGSYADPPIMTAYFANHEIIYLPDFDRYVNPTDRDAPFGALDRRLSGKLVVRVTPNGVFARTPASTPEANWYRYSAQLELHEDGLISGSAKFEMSPNIEIWPRGWLSESKSMELAATSLVKATDEAGFGTFTVSDPRDLLTTFSMEGAWQSPHAVTPHGEGMLLHVPDGLDFYAPNNMRDMLSIKGQRRTPVLADTADYEWKETISLPSGVRVDAMPNDIDLTTSVGRYTSHYKVENGNVTVYRHMVINNDVVQPQDYSELESILYARVVDGRASVGLKHTVTSAPSIAKVN